MTCQCPILGFVDFTDVSWLGQPTVGQPIQVQALLHNLSPAGSGYCAEAGNVQFRWKPFGYNGDYCSLPKLTAVPPTTDPAEAMDLYKNVMISPGACLPASIMWMPDVQTVGSGPNPKGFIVCQVLPIPTPICNPGNPPDCSSMPYNVVSARVSLLSTSMSEPPLMARAATPTALHLGFAMANTTAVDVQMKVSWEFFGSQPPPSVRFEVGKYSTKLLIGVPNTFEPGLYPGLIPRRLFADLVDSGAHSGGEFLMKSGELRQGLLELTVPEGFDPLASVLRVNYSLVEGPFNPSMPFGGFTALLADHAYALKDSSSRKDGRK